MKKFPIAEIGLSTRAWRCLAAAQIHEIGDLENITERTLRFIPGLGAKSIQDILNACETWGIELLDVKMNRINEQYKRLQDIELNNVQFVRGRAGRDGKLMRYEESK
jgi:DNA-directed RNA polymerase alpha subunit